MKMTFIRITILAHFLFDTLNWQELWGTDKYLLKSVSNIEKVFLKTNVNSKESLSSKDKQINQRWNT